MRATDRQPWHERRAGTEHVKWFQNLVDLHELTLSWIESLKAERPDYELTRGLSKEATENLWMLESLSNTQLSDFLDDTSPDDLLGRLNHAVWAAQSVTLQTLTQGQETVGAALLSALEQSSFRHGRRIAENRWSANRSLGSIPLQDALLALRDSPMSGLPKRDGLFTRRALPLEFDVLWRTCPHQIPYPETQGVANWLCDLHGQFLRGYLYVLNHHALLQKIRLTSGECALQCKLVHN